MLFSSLYDFRNDGDEPSKRVFDFIAIRTDRHFCMQLSEKTLRIHILVYRKIR